MTLTASAPRVNLSKDPKVGDGVSFIYGSDSAPGTITAIQRFKSGARAGQIRRIQVAYDTYRVVSGNFDTGDAVIEYACDEECPRVWIMQDARGTWRMSGGGTKVSLAGREYYRDPQF